MTSFLSVADLLIRGAATIAKVAILVVMVTISADALGRYLFNAPIYGVRPVVGDFLLPLIVFFGAPLVAREDGHLCVDLLPDLRRPWCARLRNLVFVLLIAAFWFGCAWQAGRRCWLAILQDQWPVGEIAIPIPIAYGLVAVGAFACGLAHLLPGKAGRR